jgi:competence protein ComEC
LRILGNARGAAAAGALFLSFFACSKPSDETKEKGSLVAMDASPVTAATAQPAAPASGLEPDLAPYLVPSLASDLAPTPRGAGARRMTVRFYDVGQGLAALVDLPGGRHVLVDAGDNPRRTGCGDPCEAASRHLVAKLRQDLGSAPIDLLFVTHQHSDHIGGAVEVLDAFPVGVYVDNGRDARSADVRRARRAAEDRGAAVRVVDPDRPDLTIGDLGVVKMTPIVPPAWPPSCAHDPNECSIGLRIDFGLSSVLFTGDAEHDEEGELDPHGPITLLQVAHHGSETSSRPAFLFRVKPKYAVISAGKPGQGYNREYCHPRALIVQRLTRVLGGATSKTLDAFDGDRCRRDAGEGWIAVPASDALWATERDGDVVLTTAGDGTFARMK